MAGPVDDLGEALQQAKDNVAERDLPSTSTKEPDHAAMNLLADLIRQKKATVQEVVQVLDHRYTGSHWYRLQIRSLDRPTGWVPQRIVNKFWSTDLLTNWRRERAMKAEAERAQELLGDVTRQPELDNAKPDKPMGLDLYPLNTQVYKVFRNKRNADQEFQGKVTGYNKRKGWLRITYQDGDWEEMTATEVRHHLDPTDLHDPNADMEEQEEFGLNIWDTEPDDQD